MSPTRYLVLLLGVVVFTSATCSLAYNHHKPPHNPGANPKTPPIHKPPTNFEEEKEYTKPQPLGDKPPKLKPPPSPKHKPPHYDHDDERKLTALLSEELEEDQRLFDQLPKVGGGKPPHGNFRGLPPPMEEDLHHDVNRDHKLHSPSPPHNPPHRPPSTN